MIDCLSARWSLQKIEQRERDFEGLRGTYDREPLLKQVLDKCNSTASFDEGWSYVANRLDRLKEFVEAWPHFLARLLSRVTFRLSTGRRTIAGFL
jgi:hypothetical protein